ncbi:DHA2 family efflux MFS transporter permease subunit [Polymorphospora sp. NPDC051019]|uniref:DHA2 family efflux MFS transporter permease subunit n=1 Tax=Polymorphospora sp. NPDC051019 TaxID=3155725 RepID=UPI0034468F70
MKKTVIYTVTLGSTIVVLDTTVVNIAVPDLALQLDASITAVGWVVAGYSLAIAGVLPIAGWAVRRHGERRIWLLALLLFAFGSVSCSLAWNLPALLTFRAVQGIGTGLIVPVGQMLLARTTGPQQMGRALVVSGAPVAVAPVFGPTLGGLMVGAFGWRGVFLLSAPVALTALAASLRWLPATPLAERAEPLDRRGALLGAVCVATLVFGLSSVARQDLAWRLAAAACVGTGLVLLPLFVRHTRRHARPVLDLGMYQRRPFALALGTHTLFGFTFYASMIVLPLEMLSLRGMSVTTAGALLAAQGAGAGLAMPLARWTMDRFGPARTAGWGLLAMLVTTLPMAIWPGRVPGGPLVALLVVRGVGTGMVFVGLQAAAYAAIRPAEVSSAAPQINIVNRIGGAMGVAVAAVLMDLAAGGVGPAWWAVIAVNAAAGCGAYALTRVTRPAGRTPLTAAGSRRSR